MGVKVCRNGPAGWQRGAFPAVGHPRGIFIRRSKSHQKGSRCQNRKLFPWQPNEMAFFKKSIKRRRFRRFDADILLNILQRKNVCIFFYQNNRIFKKKSHGANLECATYYGHGWNRICENSLEHFSKSCARPSLTNFDLGLHARPDPSSPRCVRITSVPSLSIFFVFCLTS